MDIDAIIGKNKESIDEHYLENKDDRGVYKYITYEHNVSISLVPKNINKENSILWIIVDTPQDGANNAGNINLNLDKTFLERLPNDWTNPSSVKVLIQTLGSHSVKQSITINSLWNNTDIIFKNVRFREIKILGNINYIRFDRVQFHNSIIQGTIKTITMNIVNPISPKQNSKLELFFVTSASIKIIRCNLNIFINRSIIDFLILRVAKINQFTLFDSQLGKVNLRSGEIQQFLINMNKSVNANSSKIIFSGIRIGALDLRHLFIGRSRKQSQLLFAINNILHKTQTKSWNRVLLIVLKKLNLYNKLTEFKSDRSELLLDAYCFRTSKEHREQEIFSTVNVDWNYNGIQASKSDFNNKRMFLNEMKNHYKKTEDILNLQLFKSYEKRWYQQNNNWNIPLTLSLISNSFGLSLLRPFIWIVALILIEALLIIFLSGTACNLIYIEQWGIFMHLLNPTHKTELFFEILKGVCTPSNKFLNLVYVIDNIWRIFIGYMIFQFINAFRHKYILK